MRKKITDKNDKKSRLEYISATNHSWDSKLGVVAKGPEGIMYGWVKTAPKHGRYYD